MAEHTIIGFPIQPTPIPGLPGAELAAPYRSEHRPDDPDAGEDGNVTFAVWKFKCPVCGCWGDIDGDQLHGRVSVDHTDFIRHKRDDPFEGFRCTFHETHDFYAMVFDA
jgi:hypothetical protein